MYIGATSILDQPYLNDDDSQDSSDDDNTSQDDSDDDFDQIELDDDTNDVLLDSFMASTAQGGKSRGVDPKHLSKIWRISHEDAQRTIDVTTQMSTQTDDPSLSRNYSTNDRMLRYKRIKDFFSWKPSLQPRNVANHQEAILVVNFLSLIKDSYMLFQ